MIVIGLGTGRSGTASLSKLLNSQMAASCFHEMNPSCVRFEGTVQPVRNMVDEFQAILEGGDPSLLTVDLSRKVVATAYDELCKGTEFSLLGDIAFYYLTYVEDIISRNRDVRFVCLRRNREDTIRSWLKKSSISRWRSKHFADRISSLLTRQPFLESKNFWMEHDGTRWQPDPVWDKCFPKFEGPSISDAIGQYWDFYYETSEEYTRKFPSVFRIFETERLNDRACQVDLLTFCGVPDDQHVFTDAHIHKS